MTDLAEFGQTDYLKISLNSNMYTHTLVWQYNQFQASLSRGFK